MTPQDLESLIVRLERAIERLERLDRQEPEREYYTVAEAAAILRKAPFTLRENCRLGRINAEKRASGRGVASEWMISIQEIRRIQSFGLLPSRN
jgi:hypothetical protein